MSAPTITATVDHWLGTTQITASAAEARFDAHQRIQAASGIISIIRETVILERLPAGVTPKDFDMALGGVELLLAEAAALAAPELSDPEGEQ